MGNSQKDATTPLAAASFRTVLVGAVVGIVMSVSLSVVQWVQGGASGVAAWPLILLSGASLGGVLGAGSAALALGCHVLARNTPATFQAVAAALGGGVGVGVPPLLVLGPAIQSGSALWPLFVCMLAAAAWAVVATRPLRAEGAVRRPAR